MKCLIQLLWFVLLIVLTASASADIRVLIRFDASGHFAHQVIDVPSQLTFKRDTNTGAGARRDGYDPTMSMSTIASARAADHTNNLASRRSRSTNLREGQNESRLMSDGFAHLVWLDELGRQVAQTRVPDPRITHSPSHIDGVHASRTGLETGAWLATGPDAARTIRIQLPADITLGLGPESWQIQLPVSD